MKVKAEHLLEYINRFTGLNVLEDLSISGNEAELELLKGMCVSE